MPLGVLELLPQQWQIPYVELLLAGLLLLELLLELLMMPHQYHIGKEKLRDSLIELLEEKLLWLLVL
jgi:hypothetical protein